MYINLSNALLLGSLLLAAFTAKGAQPDGYTAIVENSPRMKPGELITLGNVRSGQPIVVWPGGNAEPTVRAFQDEDYVVLVFVAKLTGGTETFYLNTKTKRFTLVEAVLLQATEPGFKPGITQGILRPR